MPFALEDDNWEPHPDNPCRDINEPKKEASEAKKDENSTDVLAERYIKERRVSELTKSE